MVGGLAVIILAWIMESLIGQSWKKIPNVFIEIVNGIVAGCFTVLIFSWLGLKVSVVSLALLCIIDGIWLKIRNEAFKLIFANVGGIAIGWYVMFFLK